MTLTIRGSLDLKVGGRRARAGAVVGLEQGVEHVLQEARRIVPNEEGTLERSGRATVDEGDLTGAVSFDTPYAVPQHERLDYRHSDGRTAKYLEGPLHREVTVVRDLVAAQIRRAMR